MALNAYRHLLRAAGVAFKGDNVRLRAARQEARKGFEIGRSLAPGTEEHSHQVLYAEEVAKVLRENVVQGEFGNEGRYSAVKTVK
ncbi:MAG: Mitochondrial zinc maintenance protein 1, mitochondrial [Bogoriella megaspora]|nr:MAG: Mitochondrial zinc maintenance protein 1, mitochondrial [Bogoriella megaspora]